MRNAQGQVPTPAKVESSDVAILDVLRQVDSLSVTQLAGLMEVTATAVRQRLERLMAQGYIERAVVRSGRGRPTHFYALTEKGRRKTGANFVDLAVALWQEIRAVQDPAVRRGLLQRISKRLAVMYAGRIQGKTIGEKMESVAQMFVERQIPFTVHSAEGLPVLTALACPYPELAEQDRSVCAMEKMLFSQLLGEQVQLSQCRLDGPTCCTFQLN
jgi:predicted ArsR family transcriptional regulator